MHGDKYLVAFFEGLMDFKHEITQALVSCHQFYGNSTNVGRHYLEKRGSYRMLQQTEIIIGESMSYRDAFNGPIKEINEYYIRHRWVIHTAMTAPFSIDFLLLFVAMIRVIHTAMTAPFSIDFLL